MKALRDVRGVAAALLAIGAVVGFVVLSALGSSEDAQSLLVSIGMPAATFLFGLASDPFDPSEA